MVLNRIDVSNVADCEVLKRHITEKKYKMETRILSYVIQNELWRMSHAVSDFEAV